MDPYNLNRFVEAQEPVYATALAEIRGGRKHTHWMWYIFPQLAGLGMSRTSQFYGIRSRREAEAYLAHPLLGARLVECMEVLLRLENPTAREVFGSPDDLKLKSCATLFDSVAAGESTAFDSVLAKYFQSARDERTVALLAGHGM